MWKTHTQSIYVISEPSLIRSVPVVSCVTSHTREETVFGQSFQRWCMLALRSPGNSHSKIWSENSKSPTTLTTFILWKQNSRAPHAFVSREEPPLFFAGDGIRWLCDLTPALLSGLISQHRLHFSSLEASQNAFFLLSRPLPTLFCLPESFSSSLLVRLTSPSLRAPAQTSVFPGRCSLPAPPLPQAAARLLIAVPNFLVSEDSVHHCHFLLNPQLSWETIC